MRFSINKTELANALNIVMKGVSTRSTLPILAGVLIETKTDEIIMQATDLELSVQIAVAAFIEEEGKAVVPGKLFSEIVRSLPDAAVSIQDGENDVKVTCDTSTFSIRTLNPEDFPAFPQVETTQSITLPFTVFTTMVKRVSRVVSRDESRAVLTGVLVELEGQELRMVATDSYRLALSRTQLEESPTEDFNAVIAGTFLTDICSVLTKGEEITLALTDNQIVITCGQTVFINRRIEGSYPNYHQLLPKDYNTRATLELKTLTACAKRASILSSSTSPMRFDLNIDTQTAQIFVSSNEVGSVQETISCEIVGDDIEIAFNSQYVNEGLSVIKDEKIYFDVQSSMKPGVFHTMDTDEYLYLIMPVRL